MSEKATYDVGLRFTVDDALPPGRNVLHTALEAVRGVIVEASSAEEAEAHVDQIRVALECAADQRRFPRDVDDLGDGEAKDGPWHTTA
jgi:hypothetical protein